MVSLIESYIACGQQENPTIYSHEYYEYHELIKSCSSTNAYATKHVYIVSLVSEFSHLSCLF